MKELKISPELEASIELGTKDDSNSSTVAVDISLDYLGRFKDQTLQSEYIIYCLEQTPIFSSLVLTALIAGWTIAETIASMWFNGSKSAYEYPFGIASFISIGIGLSLCYAIYLCSCSRHLKNSQCHSRLQVLFICSMNWIFVFKLIQQNVLGTAQCIPASLIFSPQLSGTMILAQNSSTTSYNSSEIQLCPDPDSFLSLVSFEMMLVMSFCPQLLMAILYEPRIYILFICYAAVGGLMLYSLYTSIFSILPVLIALIIIAVLLYELHMQRIQSFLTNRRLQAMLHEAERNADAVHAMEMRHMISNVAHDLKTPLASFANGMDLINNILVSAEQSVESNGITPEFFQDCVASIHSCLLNIHNTNAFMLMTINRCIDYTKASKGMKLVPKYETVNLKEALEFPMQCMSNIQDRIGIDLRQLPKGLCDYIITDKQWLQENLLCLLSNAVKYSTEGVVTITTFLTSSKPESYETKDIPRVESHNRLFREPSKLTLDSFKSKGSNSSGTYLQFEIEDTGIGLSADIMKDLFNPFKQAQRLAGGTGLGLYSLAKRTEALQGSYGVKARKDGKQGSLFWFAIPYRPDEAANISSIMRTNSVIPLMRDISCKHINPSNSFHSSSCSLNFEILIVDDSPSIVKMLSMMLRRLGYGITTAENGEIALKKIEEKWKKDQKGFDLVLMDLQMPVMDGLEATRRLRKLELEGRDWMVLPSKPTLLSPRSSRKQRLRQIIFGVSANSDHDTVKEAMDAGIDDFIGKPFSVEAFNNTLHKYFPKMLNFLGGGI